MDQRTTPPLPSKGGSFCRRVDGNRLAFWCPGCDDSHVIGVGAGGWTWDGDMECPTVSPSILVTSTQWFPGDHFYRPNHEVEPRGTTICHSFLRAGVWEFLGDCTHKMRGQNVPMVTWPEGALDER